MNRRGSGPGRAAAIGALVVAAATWGAPVAQGAGTGAAQAVRLQDDFNGDGFADLAVAAPGATVGGHAKAGYVAVVYGSATGLNSATRQVVSQDTAGIPGAAEAGDAFGSAVTGADLNGDGYADLVVGSPGEDIGTATDAGSLTVVWGGPKGLSGGAVAARGAAYDRIGALATTGDFDGDGHQDVAQRLGGDIQVLSGPFSRTTGAPAASTSVELAPEYDYDPPLAATDLAAGDLDGDGISDLVVAIRDQDLEVDERATRYLLGTSHGLGAPHYLSLPGGGNVQATSVGVGDVDGDGYADVVAGRWDGSDADGSTPDALGGSVEVVPGSANGPVAAHVSFVNQDTPGVPGAAEAGDGFGADVSVADINGDGYADVATGIPFEDFGGLTDAGTVALLHGSAAGLTGAGAQVFSQDTGGVPGAAENGDRFGAATRLVDSRGPGKGELAVGDPDENSGDGSFWVLRPGGSFVVGAGTLGTVAAGAKLGAAFDE